MYAFKTQRIWSRVVLRAESMAGMATFTMVVSSRIMKKPAHSTTSTSQGLARARDMCTPRFSFGGADTDHPLQLAFRDFQLQVAHPLALHLAHRDCVLDLDDRKPPQASRPQLG